MKMNYSKANPEMLELVNKMVEEYHEDRLSGAKIAVIMSDTTKVSKGKFILGTASKPPQSLKPLLDREYDFIISPTSPHTAFDLKAQTNDQIKMYLEDIFTVQANLAGIPAVSLPIGKNEENMPFGIQLMAKAFDEESLLSFSKTLMNKFVLKKA